MGRAGACGDNAAMESFFALVWNTGMLIARVRYGSMFRALHGNQRPPPSGSL